MSINLKEIFNLSLTALLIASVGASTNTKNVSAKRIRAHRIYHHHRMNYKKIQRIRKRNIRHRRNKKIRKRNLRYRKNKRIRKRNLRHRKNKRIRYAKRHKRAQIKRLKNKQSRRHKSGMNSLAKKTYHINPDLMSEIHDESENSDELTGMPKVYYGNFFVKNMDNTKGNDAFFHLSKHNTYLLNNPETDQGPYFAHPLTDGQMSDPNAYVKGLGYGLSFLNDKVLPYVNYDKNTNKIILTDLMFNKYPLKRLNSEKQGIYMFQTQNIDNHDYDE